MQPTTEPLPPKEATPSDVDRAFDDMAQPPSRTARARQALEPRLRDARAYVEQHKVAATMVGFSVGFILGRMLRRS